MEMFALAIIEMFAQVLIYVYAPFGLEQDFADATCPNIELRIVIGCLEQRTI